MATIYEVAAKAGVSPATVSRVFSGIRVSAAYEERVRAAAAELQFALNRTARRLRSRTSEVIALVIPDIENPFFTSLARGVEDSAVDAGLSLVLCNSDDRANKEDRYLDVVLSEPMAGLIIASSSPSPGLDRVIAGGVQVVAVDRPIKGYDLDTVLMDDQENGRHIAEQLYAQGHQVVACITGPRGTETAERRAAGWRQAFKANTPEASPNRYLIHANYRVDGGAAATRRLLAMKNPPDAIVVTNNLMGVGCLQALEELPTDAVSVGVLGDLPFGSSTPRNVSIVPLPARRMGLEAARLLIARLQGEAGEPRTVVLGLDE